MIQPSRQAADRATPYPVRRFAHDAMACTFELYLVEQDAKYARQAAEAAFAEVDRLEQELSRFVPTSDVARINALAAGLAARVGIEAFECLQLAAQLFDETAGAFDVTFDSRVEQQAGTPLTSAMHLLEFDPRRRLVGVRAAGVVIDLGGIGKGYAVDQIVTVLRDWSISAGLIHAGHSSVYALGRPPAANTWTLALRDPAGQDRTLAQVQLTDVALSGSGRALHGEHILDPRSGQPATGALAAWAAAPAGVLSDALATAFMVMSSDEIQAYCRRHADVSAFVLEQDQTRRSYGSAFAPAGG